MFCGVYAIEGLVYWFIEIIVFRDLILLMLEVTVVFLNLVGLGVVSVFLVLALIVLCFGEGDAVFLLGVKVNYLLETLVLRSLKFIESFV